MKMRAFSWSSARVTDRWSVKKVARCQVSDRYGGCHWSLVNDEPTSPPGGDPEKSRKHSEVGKGEFDPVGVRELNIPKMD